MLVLWNFPGADLISFITLLAPYLGTQQQNGETDAEKSTEVSGKDRHAYTRSSQITNMTVYGVQGRGADHGCSTGRGGQCRAGGAGALRSVPHAGRGRVGRRAADGACRRKRAVRQSAAAPAAAQLPHPGWLPPGKRQSAGVAYVAFLQSLLERAT